LLKKLACGRTLTKDREPAFTSIGFREPLNLSQHRDFLERACRPGGGDRPLDGRAFVLFAALSPPKACGPPAIDPDRLERLQCLLGDLKRRSLF
jgi:hypothetical protein